MVAAELARLQERERFLEGELRELQTRGLSAPGRLDEETVTTILGEEAARVLATARDAAVEIRERAEDSATRLVKEAVEDATRIKETAREEATRIREDANVDIEAEIELAKQQGRDMVVEAREYREKMLAELTRRRDAAKAQIDKLVHERDRLVGAFQRAKMSADEALAFLRSAHDDDEEYIFDFSRPPEAKGAASTTKSAGPAGAHAAGSQTGGTSPTGSGIFDYTADIERSQTEMRDESDSEPVKPRGMPELPRRPAFLGPAEETSRKDAFGPIDLHPTDVEVVDDEEPLEQENTSDGIVTSVREIEETDHGDDGAPAFDDVSDTAAVGDSAQIVDTNDTDDTDDTVDTDKADEADETDETDGHLATVVSLFGDRRRQPSAPPADSRSQHPVTAGPIDESEEPTPIAVAEPPAEDVAPEPREVVSAPSRVDEIFARLRAGSTAAATQAAVKQIAGTTATVKAEKKAVAPPAVPVVAAPFSPKPEPKRLVRRATVLAPIIAEIDVHLKRMLADDLNEVLERLSRKRPALTLDNIAGTAEEHLARLSTGLAGDFRAAATEGARSMKSAHGSVRRINAAALRDELERTVARLLVDGLRAAIVAAIDSASGDRTSVSDAARSIYRDARSGAAAVAADIAHDGHAAGAFMSLEPGTPVCWVVDPDGPACADGEDNSLAGVVGCGQEFPTGDKRPLAHAGCRCLLGPAQH